MFVLWQWKENGNRLRYNFPLSDVAYSCIMKKEKDEDIDDQDRKKKNKKKQQKENIFH